MRELDKPTGIAGDEKATEMIRYWIANEDHHVSLLIGMWQDAEECDVDELYAWGNVLSDIAKHIANGMEQRYGSDYNTTMKQLTNHFVECVKDRTPDLEGSF